MESKNFTTVTEFILVGLTSQRKTQIVLFVIILILYVTTVMGNLGIITLVWADSSLHKPMYFFLSNLATVEICYVTLSMPQMLAHLLAGNGAIPFMCCLIQVYIGLSLGATECLLLAAMAYDRYVAICHPLLYAIAMSRWHQLQLASASWVTAFLLAMISVSFTFRHPYCGPNRVNHFICELPVVLKLACADTHVTEAVVLLLAALVLLGSLSVILPSYGLILSSVLQMKSISGRRKAFSTCGSHLIVVMLYYGILLVMYLSPKSDKTPDSDKQIAVFYVMVIPLLNPIIYTLRNKDVHGAVAKVLRIRHLEQNVER